MKTKIRLSPMTRLYATFDLELEIDKQGTLNNLRGKFIERLVVAEQKRDATIRSLFYIDAALAILVSGKSLKVPFFDIATSDLPAILEIVTATGAIAAVFVVIAFINWASYDTILNQFAIRDAQPTFIDPDFIQAAEKQTELTMKLLRKKFNIWGVDFHEPGRAFSTYAWITAILFNALCILFPILHFILTAMSLNQTYVHSDMGAVYIIYFGVVSLANFLAVWIFVGAYRDFTFFVDLTGDTPAVVPRPSEPPN
ncbi:hypothetical protein NKH63_25845 [Mesorhizobium sp. M0960]|uniref:hypothetical protein n=1 Tax=Mesorhizobium sp. M0960 TaxID=2957035 RepID=UPI00333C66E6